MLFNEIQQEDCLVLVEDVFNRVSVPRSARARQSHRRTALRHIFLRETYLLLPFFLLHYKPAIGNLHSFSTSDFGSADA